MPSYLFPQLTLRGTAGEVAFGYRPVAILTRWTITRKKDEWTLVASYSRVDAFQLRQHPLLFTAWPGQKNNAKGRWCFEIVPPVTLDRGTLSARLGPPLY